MSIEPRLQLTIDELNSNRVGQIIALFKDLARRRDQINVKQVNITRTLILGVSDINESGTEYGSWRFATQTNNFSAMYYERWLPHQYNIYYLDRAYFHLYRTDPIQLRSEEYILLHCDANEPEEAAHAKFKQSPHLHFSFAEQPIPHSHIALNNGNLNEILSSVDLLHEAFRQAVYMINEQILIPISNHQRS
ncbi:hypothetical protein LXM25_11150 [Dyadobacter sp. LJ53]|uniref:hypothetical protein n=1 Tax=Dyadobacter chenwenxiniae TaxID=2906456 RepID=UPI001F3D6C2A|nr:hypothetical protein [Dyadobacter chenwenxiniae]MCF0050620.1 hypothetical protein [Dyadobacter chenwenxiniae]